MKKLNKTYLEVANHYANCFKTYGDTHLGLDWPNKGQNVLRFKIFTELLKESLIKKEKKSSILDFACGTSHYYEYLIEDKSANLFDYTGIDIIKEMICISKRKFPNNNYYCCDILKDQKKLKPVDFILINGLFTQKLSLNNNQMKFF